MVTDPDRYLAEAKVQFEDELWAPVAKPVEPPPRRQAALRWTPSGHARPSVPYSMVLRPQA